MKHRNKQIQIAGLEMVYAVSMIVIGCVIALMFYRQDANIYKPTIYGLELIAMAGLALQLYIYLTNSRRHVLKTYLVAAVASTVILIAAATR